MAELNLNEEIKKLRKDLQHANLLNEKLDLEIRLARADRGVAEKEAEFRRLQDPDEPTWPDSLERCCNPCVNY